MAEETFSFQVITPFGVDVETVVQEVEVPSVEGEIGFLPGHVPYAGILDVGLLHYKDTHGVEKKLVVKNGFCSFLHDKLTVLADSVRVKKATPEETSSKTLLSNQLASTQNQSQWRQLNDQIKEIEASEQL